MLENLFLGVCALAVFVAAINIPQALRSMRLYVRRDKFRCRMCGTCCRFSVIPLTPEDVKRLEVGGYKDFSEKRNGELALKRLNGRCLFVKDDKCTVYEHRPQVCREFPFFKLYGIGYAEKASFCPGMEALKNGRD
ncbi:MAG: YkgJ family cysteine cluster protein [Candidatus Altiarchaeota archaeon]